MAQDTIGSDNSDSGINAVVQETDVATQELLLTEVGGGVVVTPHPGIEVDVVPHEVSNPASTFPTVIHEVEVDIHELLLTEGGGVVVTPHPGIEVEVVPQEVSNPASTFPTVVHDVEVAMQELLLTGGGVVVAPHPGIEVEEVTHDVPIPMSTFPVVVQDDVVAMQELLLTDVGGGVVVRRHPRLVTVVVMQVSWGPISTLVTV